jgi:hypothetical protein
MAGAAFAFHLIFSQYIGRYWQFNTKLFWVNPGALSSPSPPSSSPGIPTPMIRSAYW